MAKKKILKIKVESLGTVKVYNLNPHGKFTVGYRPGNTLQLYGAQVPDKFALIQSKGGRFVLKVRDSMLGEVIAGDSRLPIPDLIRHRLLRRVKDGYILELSEDQEAWIKFHDVRFRISYDGEAKVTRGEAPYWKLSYLLYRRLTSDALFKSVLSVLLLGGIFFAYVVSHTPIVTTQKISLEKYTRHVARIIIRPKKRAALASKSGGNVAANLPEKPSRKKKTGSKSPEKPGASTAAEARKAVANKGLLGLIAGKGSANKESTVIEALVDKGLVRELDQVLQSGQDLEIELPKLDEESLGAGMEDVLNNTKLQVDNLISGMKVNDKVKLKEKGDVNLEDFGQFTGSDAALGWRSEQSIRDVIMSYMGRVTYTYNKFLKQNPDLKGKVVVEMTIAASGKVTKCRIVSSTINNPEFEQALLEVIRSFRFRPIPEGEITVQNPFLFYRRDT